MKEFGMLKKKKYLTLLLTKESTEHVEDLNTSLELFSFLLRYSFLLTDKTQDHYFFKRDYSNHGDISTKNSNGARYLDPKYSRWISVDPALGEYMSGSDAGCGGIYNPVNMSLYHYGGNNPIKYVDPDGREEYDSTITYEQWEMIPGCTFESFLDSEKKLAGKTWQETQEFFNQYPNGRIYRNPDEGFYSYNYYTNEGKDKPHYYNMYTADELFIWGIGSGLFKIGKGLFNLASKGLANAGKITISKNLTKHIISRHTLRGLRSQVGYRSINELTKKTIFNPKWSDEKIFAAAGKVIKEAFEKGITNGEYTATVFGETITASINNGVVDTVYGTVKVTEEMLLK